MKRKSALGLIVLLLVGLLTGIAFAAGFGDVANHWAKSTIEWGVKNNMVEGYPDGTFKPNNNVTEAEFLALLIRAYEGKKENGKNHWADPYYDFAIKMNYPTNGADDLAKRNWIITRTQVAEIIAGTQGVNYTGRDAIHYLLLHGLAQGRDPNNITIANFGGEESLTRAEAVQFIRNLYEAAGVTELKSRPVTPSPKLPEIGDHDRIIPLVEVTPGKPEPGVTVIPDSQWSYDKPKVNVDDYYFNNPDAKYATATVDQLPIKTEGYTVKSIELTPTHIVISYDTPNKATPNLYITEGDYLWVRGSYLHGKISIDYKYPIESYGNDDNPLTYEKLKTVDYLNITYPGYILAIENPWKGGK
jgi:hypothetical protein